ncbi:MAG: STAS domain-containing protein [Solirubrobacteraceae bacterium]
MTDGQPQRPPRVLALDRQADDSSVRELAAGIDAALSDGHRALVIDLGATPSIGNQSLGQLCGLLRGVCEQGTRVTVSGADPRVRWVLGLCEIYVLGPGPDAHERLAVQAESATGGRGHGWRARLAEWRRVREDEASEARESSTAS